jgi:hypothetical protein
VTDQGFSECKCSGANCAPTTNAPEIAESSGVAVDANDPTTLIVVGAFACVLLCCGVVVGALFFRRKQRVQYVDGASVDMNSVMGSPMGGSSVVGTPGVMTPTNGAYSAIGSPGQLSANDPHYASVDELGTASGGEVYEKFNLAATSPSLAASGLLLEPSLLSVEKTSIGQGALYVSFAGCDLQTGNDFH